MEGPTDRIRNGRAISRIDDDGRRLKTLAGERFAGRILVAKLEEELRKRQPMEGAALPSLSVAICTKDRAQRLPDC